MATDWAERAPLMICGNGASIDAGAPPHAIGPMPEADRPAAAERPRTPPARAARSLGGKVVRDWPEGAAWIARYLPVCHATGGTGSHTAAAISAVGVRLPVLISESSGGCLLVFGAIDGRRMS